jgi:hypothetical protein
MAAALASVSHGRAPRSSARSGAREATGVSDSGLTDATAAPRPHPVETGAATRRLDDPRRSR